MTAAELVRRGRERAGLSQAKLARLAGTSQAYVSKVEAGRVSPTVGRLSVLLAATGSGLVLDDEPAVGVVDDADLRAFRALSAHERLEQAFAAAAFATELHGRARRG